MSKYGETHDIFNTHHLETKAKLDSILSKNTQIEVNNDGVEAKLDASNASLSSVDGKVVSCNTGAVVVSSSALPSGASTEAKQDANNASNASIDGKIVACNTGAVVVSSSALASGASVSSKQDEIKVLIGATNTALAGTLSVSAPAVVKSSVSPVSNEAINGQSSYTSVEVDINSAKHISLIGTSSDIANSHQFDLLVSNSSGGVFIESSHSGYFIDGKFHLLISNVPYRYIKLKVKNGDSAVGNSADFSVHLLQST